MKLTHRLGAAIIIAASSSSAAFAATAVNNFGSNPGALNMYMHAPTTPKAKAGLVLSLHGCTESASANESHTGWSKLSDKYGFYVVYPQQAGGNNPYSCFNWAGYYGDYSELDRGKDENESIRQMVEYMKSNYDIDPKRVFITGFSAGGAMTNVMLATYPELFAGGAPMSGVPYRCSVDDRANPTDDQVVTNSYHCMGVGESTFQPLAGCSDESGEACQPDSLKNDPSEWKRRVELGYPGYNGSYPKVIIWQGNKDELVDDDNLIESMKQWTAVHGIDQVADSSDPIAAGKTGHTYKEYKDGNGNVLVATVEINGLKHGVSVDPGNGEDQGGVEATYSYSYDTGVYSSYYNARFWGLLEEEPTINTPTVDLTSPANGATVKGSVLVSANATDVEGIASVDFFKNGTLVTTLTQAPYQVSWDTTAEAEGASVTWKVTAYDVDNTTPASDSATVTVKNQTTTQAPTVAITSPSNGAEVSDVLTINADANDDGSITKVVFKIGATSLTDTSAPYSVSVNLGAYNDGDAVAIQATATDDEGLTSTDSITVYVNKDDEPTTECESFTAYNFYHAAYGRAKNTGSFWLPKYTAVGSGDSLGNSGWLITTVHTTSAGVYNVGDCP